MNAQRKHPIRLIVRHAALAAPVLWAVVACGPRDNATVSDSAGGAMAMSDSAGATGTMSETGSPNNAGMTDPSMAQLIAVVNRGEISSGTLASTKARNADVKAFARQMVDEHRMAQRRLDSIAKPSGWRVDSASIASDMGGMSGMSSTGNTGGTSGGTGTGGTGAGGTGGTGTGGATGTGTGGTGTGGSTTGGTTGNNTTGGVSQTNPGGDSRLNTMMMEMQDMQAKSMQALRSASGAEFDRSYIDSQLAGHQQTLDLLNQYMNNVQNNDLRTYLNDVKASVEKHRARAEEIRSKLGSA